MLEARFLTYCHRWGNDVTIICKTKFSKEVVGTTFHSGLRNELHIHICIYICVYVYIPTYTHRYMMLFHTHVHRFSTFEILNPCTLKTFFLQRRDGHVILTRSSLNADRKWKKEWRERLVSSGILGRKLNIRRKSQEFWRVNGAWRKQKEEGIKDQK